MKLLRITGLATLALLFSTVAATGAFADTLQLGYAAGHPAGFPGGAFRATNVVGGPLAGTSFDTFCLETGEFFSPGGTYNYVVNSAAVHGGTATSDPISIGTAYLYNDYLQNGGDQKAIQQAIWFLEDEATTGDEVCGTACQAVLTAAEGALGKTEAEIKADCAPSQCNGVVALNLTSTDGNNTLKQDQLGRVPEAGATLLLSMSLVGLTWFARRKKLLPQSPAQVGSFA